MCSLLVTGVTADFSFYEKKTPDVARKLKDTEKSRILPNHFQDKVSRKTHSYIFDANLLLSVVYYLHVFISAIDDLSVQYR